GGREPVPACGFSYGLERVDLAVGDAESVRVPRILVVGVTAEDHPAALGLAAELRKLESPSVEQDLRLRGVKAALRYADRAGVDLVVIVGERERVDNTAVLRNMATRAESRVARADLLDTIRAALA